MKRSSITFKVDGNKLEATLFLTNEDLEKSGIKPDSRMGTSYGINWHSYSEEMPTSMQTEGPERLPDGASWKYTGNFSGAPWFDILEFDTNVFPVYVSRNQRVEIDYKKWMDEDKRPKKLYKYSCVERMVVDGYVWARSKQQAMMLARDYVTGTCEYQNKEMPIEEWFSDGIEYTVGPATDEPGRADVVLGHE